MAQILFPEWRNENQPTNYPFAMNSALTNGSQTILEGTVIDAIFYPVGGQPHMRLSQVDVAYDMVTLWLGDEDNAQRASGSFNLPTPQSNVVFTDAFKRPAGLLIGDPQQLTVFSTWGIGSFAFNAAQTEFAATCCVPTPQTGVRGIVLPDGSVFSGDVWMMGADGVILSLEESSVVAGPCTAAVEKVMAVRVDVVGDPLFQRRLCFPYSLFKTPQFLKTLTFTDGQQTIVVGPDNNGDVKLTVNNNTAADTVLRVHPTSVGTVIEVVGSTFTGVA